MRRKYRRFFYEKFCFYRYSQEKKVNSVEECIKIKSWLLLIFFICLRSQLKFYNSRTHGNRRTPRSSGTSGPPGNLVPLWGPRTPGILGTSMVPVSTRTLGRSKFTIIKSNNSLQAVITCLRKFKFHTSYKILFLSKQLNWNCSHSELALH